MLEQLGNMTFHSAAFFFLLLLIPLFIWVRYKFRRIESDHFPLAAAGLDRRYTSWKITSYPLLSWLSILAFIFLVIALARPRIPLKKEEIKSEGIDIILAMDISASMLAKDFDPDRLTASKEVAIDFVRGRKHDRIGLVAFGSEAYTQCPLTLDRALLNELLSELDIGPLSNGTAVGHGLSLAISRIKDSEAESKVIIFLTDGENNKGHITPEDATEIAKNEGIKVYTIGVGTNGYALTPAYQNMTGTLVFSRQRCSIDEELLEEIAETTGGRYFRATDMESLIAVYDEIEKLEKTELEVQVFKRYSEEYRTFLWIAIALLALRIVLKATIFRTVL